MMKASQGSGTICVLGQATGVGVVVVVAGTVENRIKSQV